MDNAVVKKAIAAIKSADLMPIKHLMLLEFVKEAYEPNAAARVVLDRISDDDRPVDETLRVLKEDWHELVGISMYLCLTPQTEANTKHSVVSCPAPFDAHLRD